MKLIVTPIGLYRADDADALREVVEELRLEAKDSKTTDRYVSSEPNAEGLWEVLADERGINPFVDESEVEPIGHKVISAHANKDEAEAEADRINAEIDADLLNYMENDAVEVPENVTDFYMDRLADGYEQTRSVTASFTILRANGENIEVEVTAHWVGDIADRNAINANAVAKVIRTDLLKGIADAEEEAD